MMTHEEKLARGRAILAAYRACVCVVAMRGAARRCEAPRGAVVRSSGVKFPNGAGLQDKFNGLNAWCRVTVLDLNQCELREGGDRRLLRHCA